MSNVLIAAVDHALGIPLAARYLATSDAQISYALPHTDAQLADELKTSLCAAVREISPESSSQLDCRFHVIPLECRTPENSADVAAIPDLPAATIWFVSGGCFPSWRSARNAAITNALRIVLSAIPAVKAIDFNYVCSALGAVEADHDLVRLQQSTEEYIAEQCKLHNAKCRIFHTTNFLGKTAPFSMRDGHDFLQFMAALHDLRAEVEGRSPQYFSVEPLRCCVSPNATIGLVDVNKLTETMLHEQQKAMGTGGKYSVTALKKITFADLCLQLGTIYKLNLLAVEDRRVLNSIDSLLDRRTEYFRQYLLLSEGEAPEGVTQIPSESLAMNSEEISSRLEAIRSNQDEAYTARKRCIASGPTRLEKRSLDRNGLDLAYLTGGSGGPPLIVLNALGQRLDYWYELIETLARFRRVIAWETRGLTSPSPFSLTDQVDDLAAILKQEGIDACHLLGWCTGPKLGLRFYLRYPQAVLSMVCLNSTFKWPRSPKELSTPYEEGLDRVCQIFTTDAKLGALMVNILKKNMEDGNAENLAAGGNSESRASEVLSKTNKDLLPHIMAPFQNKDIAVNYSRQILEFFAYDAREDAKQMQAPVLLLSCQFDKIAAPAMSQIGRKMFPVSRYLQIQGATHHCIYDRPELIAGLVEDFLLDPNAALTESREVREIAIGAGR